MVKEGLRLAGMIRTSMDVASLTVAWKLPPLTVVEALGKQHHKTVPADLRLRPVELTDQRTVRT